MINKLSKRLLLGLAVPLCAGFVTNLAPAELPIDPSLPHPEEIRLMEELAAWTGESPTSSRKRPFPESVNLASSVQRYPESFSLFRQVARPHGRSATLAALPFGSQIERVSRSYGVDPLLVAAIVSAESGFDPGAISPVGARGLMQLMPATARYLGASEEDEMAAADPLRNLELGISYVGRLMKLYGDDVPLVLAAYNSGPGNVRKFGGIPPFAETQAYVERVLERYIDLQNEALAADRVRRAELALQGVPETS